MCSLSRIAWKLATMARELLVYSLDLFIFSFTSSRRAVDPTSSNPSKHVPRYVTAAPIHVCASFIFASVASATALSDSPSRLIASSTSSRQSRSADSPEFIALSCVMSFESSATETSTETLRTDPGSKDPLRPAAVMMLAKHESG
ncbi:hypothetical protein PanWU01x14_174520 [Parasponia andersonii]|uniref:Uncharacterized protein n=1 Tax=Parasponia andersonii TaxID=3476 RepID=A0A2P5C8L6_PARAD|nr:hypothetical protein PanWU01x14_174520 [Parasponia andersonii]